MDGFPDQMAVVALLEERHFGRAARRLGVSQPALTARLRRLEARIGARLFDRGRGGVAATAAGIAYAEGARRVLETEIEATEAARAAQDGFGGVLRVGFTQIACPQLLPEILADFRRAHPEARLSLIEGTTHALERGLEQSMVDVALLHPPLYAKGLSTRPIARRAVLHRNLHREGAGRPPVGVPRHEAPMLTVELDRVRDRLGGATASTVEADTMLGALILSAAGYGPAVFAQDAPDFGFAAASDAVETGLELEISAAWRSLDRRPILQALLAKMRPETDAE